MSELTFEVKEFIEENIDLIEEKRWDEVYDNAKFNLDSESTGNFTSALLSVGVNPLKDIDYIPDYYMSDQKIESFTIPETIHLISEGAFSYTELTSILIPESVKEIGPYAFYECLKLKQITILGSDVVIDASAFMYISEDAIIMCQKGSFVEDRIREIRDGWSVKYI